jgi:hypothetical protein
MLDKKSILKLFSNTLGFNVEEKDYEKHKDQIKEWDSLAHLAILTSIDLKTNKKASGIKNLATAQSIKDIHTILIKNKLSN